jgi:hypothetical protein
MCIDMHCSAAPYYTHDNTRLVNLMKSCNGLCWNFVQTTCTPGRIQQAIRKSKSQVFEANDVRALLLVLLIAALLVEHWGFDCLRSEDECTLRVQGIANLSMRSSCTRNW